MQQPNDMQKKLQKKRGRELAAYFRTLVAKEGLVPTLRRTALYLKRRYGLKKGRFLPKKAALARQRSADTTGWPTISVCVPVYNPDPAFFAQLLASVKAQSYPHWQLCLADASSDPAVVAGLVAQAADRRVQLKRIENAGIALNTNRAADIATGEYIALLDHDDLLGPSALFEMAKAAKETGAAFLYSDEALFTTTMQKAGVGHFKPDYAPQYLLNCNYITHLAVIKRDVFWQVGGLRPAFDGAQDHDLFLRVLELTGGAVHIPKVLYFWRQHAGSTSTGVAAKPYVEEAAIGAIDEHLQRTGVKGRAVKGLFPSTYKVEYEIAGTPLISIIIPSYEHSDELAVCLRSIYEKTLYPHFEVVVVENNSRQPATFQYYEKAKAEYPGLRVEAFPPGGAFNFSALCNFGRRAAKGEYLLFLNNDTEVITPGWLGEMLSLCQQPRVGVVGAMLYYPDDTVQHAGVVTGLGGYAGHSHKYAARGRSGYMFRQAVVQEVSAVTGACLLCGAAMFDEIGGFDEGFSVAYNDVDFCLRAGRAGCSVVFTPYAELYHHESKSRGLDEQGEAKTRFDAEKQRLQQRYGASLLRDPYYNPNLTLDREDFTENDVLTEV